jgi:elongation factor 1 alpha-like protein
LAKKNSVQGNPSSPIPTSASRVTSPIPGSKGGKKSSVSTPKKGIGTSTPLLGSDQGHIDIMGLNLYSNGDEAVEEAPKISFAREKLLEEAKRSLEAEEGNANQSVSLVVIGKRNLLASGTGIKPIVQATLMPGSQP